MKAVHGKLFEASCHVEQIIWIAGMLEDDWAADPLDDLLEDVEKLRAIFPDLPDDVADYCENGSSYERRSAFFGYAYQKNKFGLLVQFSTPVMRYVSESASEFSWGHAYLHWVYADNLTAAVDLGLIWVAQRRQAELDRFKKEGK